MKLSIFFISIGIGIISYMTYNINKYMENPLELRELNSINKNCHHINIQTTMNYLIPFKENYLIASEYKPFDLYEFHSYLNNKIYNDILYLIDVKTEKYSVIKINDFPSDVPFHPHGLSLFKKSENEYILYVINHAVDYNYKGRERIEKINIIYNPKDKDIKMYYDSSISLPEEYFLRVDSIAVINEDVFYFTTNAPFPSPTDSEELSDLKAKILFYASRVIKLSMTMLNIKQCKVYLYNNKSTFNKISVISESESLLNKGIAFDKKRNLLYVMSSMEKELNIFKIKNKDDYDTKLIKKIPILYVGNNIYYDDEKDLIYIGINGKMNEFDSLVYSYKKNKNFENLGIFSGYEIISPKNDYSINELTLFKNEFKWVSSSIQVNDKNYMSSIFTKGINVCSDIK